MLLALRDRPVLHTRDLFVFNAFISCTGEGDKDCFAQAGVSLLAYWHILWHFLAGLGFLDTLT